MQQPMIVLFATGLLSGASIHISPATSPVTPPISPETSLVVPPGSRMLTRLVEPLSAGAARPGDTIYLRVASPLRVAGRIAIEEGSFIEATVSNGPAQASTGRFEMTLRFRRLISSQGDIADVFTVGASPNDSAYRRGVIAVADLPRRDRVVTMTSVVPLVMDNAFTVDTRRSLASALGRRVRVVGTPPRVECLVESWTSTPDITIPGTPPTPAIGDFPGTPGTPDIVIPGAPDLTQSWQPCR